MYRAVEYHKEEKNTQQTLLRHLHRKTGRMVIEENNPRFYFYSELVTNCPVYRIFRITKENLSMILHIVIE